MQSCNKENVAIVSSRFSQHEKPAVADEGQEVVMTRDRYSDRTRQEVVNPDRRSVVVGGRRENVMKRKTLRRCDDGRMSVSESFTESETTEAGTQLIVSNKRNNCSSASSLG